MSSPSSSSSPISRQRHAIYLEKQQSLNQAKESYKRCKDALQELRSRLSRNVSQQASMYAAVKESEEQSSKAVNAAQSAKRALEVSERKLRDAMEEQKAAKQCFERAEAERTQKLANKAASTTRLNKHEEEASELRKRIEAQEDSLSQAEVDVQNKTGHANAALQQLQESDHVGNPRQEAASSSSGVASGKRGRASGQEEQSTIPQEPIAKRPRTEDPMMLPTWTTGKIFSARAGQFVDGYPHQASDARMQRFIVHFDTGNSAQTIISKVAFDYLGLSQTSPKVGDVTITGVGGHQMNCPVHEIKFCVDVVIQLKPGTIFQRTVKAAVLDDGRKPGQLNYHDLLVNAADTRKLSSLEVNGRGLRLEVLATAPATLYDCLPLRLQATFSTPAPMPRVQSRAPGLDPDDIFQAFFGGRMQCGFYPGAPSRSVSQDGGLRANMCAEVVAC
eukprot:TRINITY_DN38131_c0_g1_i1.p1 TRINITY_DN38131_c0_g1~~TRINITY_DN38131_c0_g1_i1.p1  ORF type:complete len:461 (-),score=66.05 TRINITY_DN38131_c0_g1_i1:147-1487(-)